MRIAVSALLALAAVARGEGDSPPGEGSPIAPADYEPRVPGSAIFAETFQREWESRWVYSTKEVYSGKFEAQPYAVEGIAGDVGLVMPTKARRYGLSRKLDAPVQTSEHPLIVQYEVSLKGGLECGGAYIKLLNVDATFDGAEFEEPTPYSIMFGPDKCANAGKIHFIVKFKHPITGEWSEHHLQNGPPMPPTMDEVVMTHLYRFALQGDNKFSITVDDNAPQTFSLLEDLDPPIIPPKEIDDPTDLKPEDWEDEARIPDPDAVKPDDWDEDAPFQIPDPEAVKPEGWHDDAPLKIPDPSSSKPADWDDDEDGEWEAPLVSNPACSNPGCGEWQPPMVANPAYKGKWFAPIIDNPKYKGEFKPRQIPNPAFFEDAEPWKSLAPIGAVGLELWTMDEGTLFDNVLITRSPADAEAFTAATWGKRHGAEMAARYLKEKEREALLKGSTWTERLMYYGTQAVMFASENPVPAGLVIFFAVASFLILCCMPSRETAERPTASGSRGKAPAPRGKEEGESSKEGERDAPVEADAGAAGTSSAKAPAKSKATRRTPKAAE